MRNDIKVRGCYEIEQLKGVFNKNWKNETSLLLNLIIYTTGMRNSEIKRIRADDIQNIDGCCFIKVKESKTEAVIRLVPLHNFVYRKIIAYAVKNKKKGEI
jgi:integrase